MNGELQVLVGINIRRFRQRLGWSQEELADRCSLHRTYIGGIERGERNITLETLSVIAQALNCTPTELMSKEAES